LLFICDYGANDVDIFTMPQMALKGQLTGLSFPEGECTDASGNVWVANTGASAMQLYSRTGTLLKTLSVAGEYPSGCAATSPSCLREAATRS
jgi:sugar lactone lactonase YvrE